MELNNEKTLEFIDSYRQYTCLWRSKGDDYKDRILRSHAINKLSAKYGMTTKMVLNKIKSVRSYFHREHAKVSKRKSDGYRSFWFAYTSMLFILEDDSYDAGTETEILQNYELDNSNFHNKEREDSMIVKNEQIEEDQELIPRLLSDEPPTAKQRKANEVPEEYGTKRKRTHEEVSEPNNIAKDDFYNRDEFSHFGELIACKLRKLVDPRLQSIAQFQINKTMFEIEMKSMERHSKGTSCSFTHELHNRPSSTDTSCSLHLSNWTTGDQQSSTPTDELLPPGC